MVIMTHVSISQVFGLCDRDANGFISKDELADICKQVSDEEVASSVVDNVMSTLDKDHDGLISFEEFKAGFQVCMDRIVPSLILLMLCTHCRHSSTPSSQTYWWSQQHLAPPFTREVLLWNFMSLSQFVMLMRQLGRVWLTGLTPWVS